MPQDLLGGSPPGEGVGVGEEKSFEPRRRDSQLPGDGRILGVNERMADLTGFPREALVGARPPYPVWPAADAGRYGAFLAAALRSGVAGEVDRTYTRARAVRSLRFL